MFIKFFKNSIFILLLSFVSGAAFAAPDMSVGTVSGLANATVTVPITFTNGTGTNAAASMLVRVNYDTSKLTFVSGASTGLISPVPANAPLTDSFSASASGGVVTIQAIRIPNSAAFTNGTINLQFTINASVTGAAAITLQPATTAETFKNTSLDPIPATSTNFSTAAAATAVAGAVNVTPPNTAGTVNITGTPQVGQTLTANVADANGTTGVTITYQWSAGGAAIAGANAMTYTLTSNELGKTITVQANYTDQNGYAESPTSAATAAVTPTTTPTPGVVTITGTPQVGQTLTANVTDVNGIAGNITYVWSADGTVITGATTANYTPTTDDVGKVITVQAIYTDQIPNTPTNENPTSAATQPVASAPVTTSNPANIPVFGPFGLLAVLAGLFFFGNRRRKN